MANIQSVMTFVMYGFATGLLQKTQEIERWWQCQIAEKLNN